MDQLKFSLSPLPAGTSLRHPAILLATWFGAGLVRPAPGTIGTLASIPAGYLIVLFAGQHVLAMAVLALLFIGAFAAHHYGKKSGTVDDQSIVVDETVGVWIAALPASTHISLWVAAFLLFRFFDIWKPWPASLFDKRSQHGLDVMMDDVVAGLYALLGVCICALVLI